MNPPFHCRTVSASFYWYSHLQPYHHHQHLLLNEIRTILKYLSKHALLFLVSQARFWMNISALF